MSACILRSSQNNMRSTLQSRTTKLFQRNHKCPKVQNEKQYAVINPNSSHFFPPFFSPEAILSFTTEQLLFIVETIFCVIPEKQKAAFWEEEQ